MMAEAGFLDLIPMNRLQLAFRSKLFRAGLILFVVGSGPLLLIMAAASLGLTRDPNPNPVGFGMLAALTFWPAIAMMAIAFAKAKPPGRL
jgi:hypothetical protein